MILEKLRAATGEAHQQLEKAMLPLIVQVNDRTAYAALLRLFYGFYAPLHRSIQQQLNKHELPDHASRREPSWLLNDLQFINEPATGIPVNSHTPAINSNAAAFGALYVMEGSTLGGKTICKILSDNLGMEPPAGLSFFYGYGKDTGVKWKDFLASLHHFSGTPEETAVIEAANNVFLGFNNWIKAVYLSTGKTGFPVQVPNLA